MTEDAPTVPDTVADDGRPSLLGRLVRLLGLFLVLLVIGLTAAAGALLYPYLRDDLVIDGIVRVVALDWRDFGRARAEERLRFEFDRQEIGAHASAADCTFLEKDGARTVVCAWEVEVRVAGRTLTLPFGSRAAVDASGDLR